MHIREAIRDEVVTLVGGLSTYSSVYNSRLFPFEQTDLPCWVVVTGDETSEPDSMGGGQNRQLDLEVTAHGRARSGELLAELFDAMAEELETAMTLNALTNAAAVHYRSTEFEYDAEATDQALGSMMVTFTVVYYTTQGAPSA